MKKNAQSVEAWLEAMIAVARYYRLDFSQENVRATVNWERDSKREELLTDMARQLGMGLRLVEFSTDSLNPWRLPLIAVFDNQQIGVITRRDNHDNISVQFSGDEGLETTLNVTEIEDNIVELALLFLVFAATIALVQAVRKIPVQYAKRIVGNKQYGGVRQYIPLKINAAGVMPIIFAQALMFIPALFSKFESTSAIGTAFSNYSGFWYNLVFGLLVVAFTYFYTAITVNPNMMAEDMKRNGGFIPGVKPGKKTVDYLDTIMTRITLPGSVFLAIVAILPAFAMKLGINNQFALFYGGTSLLILVGVILDTLQQIESYLLLRHYDGLMKTGRIKGRSA